MKTLCIIPARGGSTRLKRKNVRLLKGVPLITYTLQDAKEAQLLKSVVVSTDDNEIASVSEKGGIKVIHRPAEFASNDSPIYFTLRHAVRSIEAAEGWLPDIVVWLQPNVPFREKRLVDIVTQKLIDNFDKADSVVTVYEVSQFPEAMRVVREGILEYRELPKKMYFRTQDFPKYYLCDGSVQAIKTSVLIDESRPIDNNAHFYLGRMMPYIHGFPYTLEVDEEKDFVLLEYVMERNPVD